ncbi:MAG: cation diffusion facilitator family transporter [Thiotrichaceae bacterium]
MDCLTNSMALADVARFWGQYCAGFIMVSSFVSSAGTRSAVFLWLSAFFTLSALITSIILIVGSIIILFNAIPRLLHPETVHVNGMIMFAILGVIVNGSAVLRLRNGKTQNERMVMLHLLEDVLGWIAVLIVSIVMLFADLPWLDPLLSIGITGYILWNVLKNLWETIRIFLQAAPEQVDSTALISMLTQQIPAIQSIHDWHVWTLDGEHHILSLHVVVADDVSMLEIIQLKQQIRDILKQQDIHHATIEIEYKCEECELLHH